jgi:hypothetical protein
MVLLGMGTVIILANHLAYKTQISNLVRTTLFWNILHQGCLKSKSWKPNDLECFGSNPKNTIKKYNQYEKHYTGVQPVHEKHYTRVQPVHEKHYTGVHPVHEKHYTGVQPVHEKHYTGVQPVHEKHYTGVQPVRKTLYRSTTSS